jgi:hypothetical protein
MHIIKSVEYSSDSIDSIQPVVIALNEMIVLNRNNLKDVFNKAREMPTSRCAETLMPRSTPRGSHDVIPFTCVCLISDCRSWRTSADTQVPVLLTGGCVEYISSDLLVLLVQPEVGTDVRVDGI